jgi:hypothetical protein
LHGRAWRRLGLFHRSAWRWLSLIHWRGRFIIPITIRVIIGRGRSVLGGVLMSRRNANGKSRRLLNLGGLLWAAMGRRRVVTLDGRRDCCIVGRTNPDGVVIVSNHAIMQGRQKDSEANQDTKTSHGLETRKEGRENERQKVCKIRQPPGRS